MSFGAFYVVAIGSCSALCIQHRCIELVDEGKT